MRKPFALLLAVMLIAAATAWWMIENFAVSVVPGWHTPILAPWSVLALLVCAVLFGTVSAILFRLLGGRKSAR
jgi:H+/Cl- antiporter ClcA